MHRNSITLEDFRISPVEDFTVFAGFSCLNDGETDRDLDEFILNDAESHYKDKIAVTYKMTFNGNGYSLLLGFATLQNDAITVETDGTQLGLPGEYKYKSYPAVKIGRMGIDNALRGSNFGTLFIYMLKMLLVTNNRTGCRFVTVDAWRDKRIGVDVRPFYEKSGFKLLEVRDKTRSTVPMYFDLSTFSLP